MPSTAASAISSSSVRLAVGHAIALLDGRAADCLREMAPAGARRAEEERVFALLDEARRGQIVDECPIHLLVEIEIKALERPVGIAETGQLVPARQEPVFPSLELVGHERGDQIQWGQPLGLGMPESGFEDIGHAGEPEFSQRAVYFDEIHSEPPVF